MANRERGEIALEADGQTYVLALGLEGMCEVEDALSTPTQRVTWLEGLRRMERGGLIEPLAIIRASFTRHHKNLSSAQIADLVMRSHGWNRLHELASEVIAASSPDAKDLKALGAGKTRPRKARSVGTGGASTSTGDGSGSTAKTSGH